MPTWRLDMKSTPMPTHPVTTPPAGPAPATPGATSMAVWATRLAGILLVGSALLAGLLVAAVQMASQYARALASAEALAAVASAQPAAMAESKDAALLLQSLSRAPDGEWRAWLDGGGRRIAAVGDRQARDWPAFALQQAVVHGGEIVGHIEVHRTWRGALVSAIAVALACGTGGLLYWQLRLAGSMGALRRAEGRWRAVTTHDVLTGLLNREGLRRQLKGILERHQGGRRRVAVLVLDVDRFRHVNESYGTHAGDELLRSVAARMREVTRNEDLLARLGGDQFAVCIGGISGGAVAAAMARNLLRAFEQACAFSGHAAVVTPSIGVAVAGPEDDGDALVGHAEAAMRTAKQSGGGLYRLYDAAMDPQSAQWLEREQQMRRALREDEFFLQYQPIVDGEGRHVVAVEALMRWRDPQLGIVAPSSFIPVLEQTGLIVPAGRWALQEACRQAAQWAVPGAPPLMLSVNVSPRQFAEPDFLDMLRDAVTRAGLEPSRLQVEVTEGLLLDPSVNTLAKLDALHALGVRVAIDDFGVGYSSLAYLRQFRLHALKFDRLFVQGLGGDDPQPAAIVQAIVALGHSLGLAVTAEGVETQAQFEVLRQLGCDRLQGWLFGQPCEASDIAALISHGLGRDTIPAPLVDARPSCREPSGALLPGG